MKLPVSKICALIVLIFSFAFLSCSMADDVVVYDTTVSVAVSPAISNVLHGKLDQKKNFETRTIMDQTVRDFTSYDYYMYGMNSSSGIFPITPIEVDTDTGIFSINLSSCYWNLTVFALRKGTEPISDIDKVHSNAILIGNAAADLSKSAANATFTMSVGSLSTGGYAYFDIDLSNDSGKTYWDLPYVGINDYRVYASLKYIITGNEVPGSGKELGFTHGGHSTTYSAGPFTPGTYLFELSFYDPDGIFKGSWEDSIVIVAGQSQTQKINGVYVPNVLGLVPDSPENFYATYYTGSEDSSEHDGTYKLRFDWQDRAINETHFELQLAEVELTSEWDPVNPDLSWKEVLSGGDGHSTKHLLNLITYDKSYLSHTEYIDGSTNANSSHITVYAKLGVQYQARIRAVNALGASEWLNVALPSSRSEIPDVSDKAKLSYFGEDYGDGSRASNIIHRGRITYNLLGGSYNISADARVQTPKISYFTQMNPNRNDAAELSWWKGPDYWDGSGYDSSSTADDLADGTKMFHWWSTKAQGDSSYRCYDKTSGAIKLYKLAENVSFYAEYEDSKLDPAASYRLLASWITYSAGGTDMDTVTNDKNAKRAVVTLSRGTVTDIVFNLKVPESELNYDKVTAKILDSSYVEKYTSTGDYTAAGYELTMDLSDQRWVNGLYEVEFAASKLFPDDSSLYEKCYLTLIITD